jgi:hypothetical protein
LQVNPRICNFKYMFGKELSTFFNIRVMKPEFTQIIHIIMQNIEVTRKKETIFHDKASSHPNKKGQVQGINR